MLTQLKADLKVIADPKKAHFLARFFKTGKGQYAEGDQFIGVTVPNSRAIAKKYGNLPFTELKKLLASKIHEERLIALLILVHQFEKSDLKQRKHIVDFYLSQTEYINNWDLVDLSADKIVGVYLLTQPRDILYDLIRSKSVWERRIALLASFQFIKTQKDASDTFRLVDLVLTDRHDLIQKAAGWMLREVGKRVSQPTLEGYLKTRFTKMPRTMLRYAIEHFPPPRRQAYLAGMIS